VEDWLSVLAHTEPLLLSRLLLQRRWLTLHRLSLPVSLLSEARADFVVHHWPAVAARIADDIANHRLPPPDQPVVIQARYHPRAMADQFAQEF
jgi:hypothetical protein